MKFVEIEEGKFVRADKITTVKVDFRFKDHDKEDSAIEWYVQVDAKYNDVTKECKSKEEATAFAKKIVGQLENE